MLAIDFVAGLEQLVLALPVLLATQVDEIRGFLAQPGQEVAAGQFGALRAACVQQEEPRQ